jgi:hypothetical protein
VPEKKPPIKTKTTTITMLSQTSLTGGVLLGSGLKDALHAARTAAPCPLPVPIVPRP